MISRDGIVYLKVSPIKFIAFAVYILGLPTLCLVVIFFHISIPANQESLTYEDLVLLTLVAVLFSIVGVLFFWVGRIWNDSSIRFTAEWIEVQRRFGEPIRLNWRDVCKTEIAFFGFTLKSPDKLITIRQIYVSENEAFALIAKHLPSNLELTGRLQVAINLQKRNDK